MSKIWRLEANTNTTEKVSPSFFARYRVYIILSVLILIACVVGLALWLSYSLTPAGNTSTTTTQKPTETTSNISTTTRTPLTTFTPLTTTRKPLNYEEFKQLYVLGIDTIVQQPSYPFRIGLTTTTDEAIPSWSRPDSSVYPALFRYIPMQITKGGIVAKITVTATLNEVSTTFTSDFGTKWRFSTTRGRYVSTYFITFGKGTNGIKNSGTFTFRPEIDGSSPLTLYPEESLTFTGLQTSGILNFVDINIEYKDETNESFNGLIVCGVNTQKLSGNSYQIGTAKIANFGIPGIISRNGLPTGLVQYTPMQITKGGIVERITVTATLNEESIGYSDAGSNWQFFAAPPKNKYDETLGGYVSPYFITFKPGTIGTENRETLLLFLEQDQMDLQN